MMIQSVSMQSKQAPAHPCTRAPLAAYRARVLVGPALPPVQAAPTPVLPEVRLDLGYLHSTIYLCLSVVTLRTALPISHQ